MAEDLRISQLPKAQAGVRDGVYAKYNPLTDQTEQIALQADLGAVRASMEWQVATTYAAGDFVLYQGLTAWKSLVSSNTSNVPAENSFWTTQPISTADGITDTQWASGLFTYNDSKIVFEEAQYFLTIATPFESVDVNVEIGNGTWGRPAVAALPAVQFVPQVTDPPHSEGLVFYDKDQEMFSGYNDKSAVKMTFGRELWKRGINLTGGLLLNGNIVKSGPVDVTSQRPTILLVGAGDVDINDTLGFLTEDCPDGDECEITTFGDLHELNTLGFTEGVLYMGVTPGSWSNTAPTLPNAIVNMGRFEKIDAIDGRVFVRIIPPELPRESSFNPSFSSFGTGLRYVTGGYLFGASNFIPSGTPQPLGIANVAHGMHAFVVIGAASTDMIVRVTGTSYIDEGGVRTPADTEDIDTSGGGLNDYFETNKKWIGQINYTLLSGTGININYGFTKYWDNRDKPFIVTQVEWDGEAGFNDTTPNVQFFHHSANGWTYNVGSTPTPAPPIADMQVDYVTEFQFSNGLKFNYKKTGLSQLIVGDTNEGLITAVTVNNSNSVASSNFDIKFIE